MRAQRLKVPDGTAIANDFDYSLKRLAAHTHYLNDGATPKVESNAGGDRGEADVWMVV
ncbi:hypothetical protein [Hahella sp. KA22]|uniref:hypothetical protein n=1 Tax=Hahella sp. KA22 TaxID=1628392 RepID=UPI0013E3BB26|nr:hypothetical protein [Hahella sp. KA22]